MADATTPFTDPQLQDIQGFGVAGFNKDQQETLFLKINSPAGGKELLAWLAPRAANAYEVGTFNAVFREVSGRTGGEEPLKATWIAALLSASGYSALGVALTGLPGGDPASPFGAGMAARANEIGDTLPGDVPTGWLPPFRPGVNEVHVAVVVASDDECDLNRQVVAVYQTAVETGCDVVFHERGATLPAPLTGHEHFGFKDGISQPAITGYGRQPTDVEPVAVAPGEFVLGFPDNAGATAASGTVWANGSFVAFRRLTQDVAAFRAQEEVAVPGDDPGISPGLMGAKMIGRWPSGAPLELFPDGDPGPGHESNDFQFKAPGDDDGHTCPVWAHIRKVNPRDESTPGGAADDPSRHRMIRRGIPFGLPLPANATADDGTPRGLHFFCVVADLDRQFEFIQRNWMNNANFPVGSVPAQPGGNYTPPVAGTPPGGPDPIVGEHDGAAQDALVQTSGIHPFPVAVQLVHPTAGEYFFLPSISALSAWSTD